MFLFSIMVGGIVVDSIKASTLIKTLCVTLDKINYSFSNYLDKFFLIYLLSFRK